MLQPRKQRYDKAGPVVAENLKKRHFDAYYCSTREEAIAKVMELIGAEDVVSWGGTMTVDELGIKQLLAEPQYSTMEELETINRNKNRKRGRQ